MSVWCVVPLSDVFNPCAGDQPENQPCVQRVFKPPGVSEILSFSGDVFLMYLSCGVTLIRSKITCLGIAWEVHCLRGLYQFKPVDILFYVESCFHL